MFSSNSTFARAAASSRATSSSGVIGTMQFSGFGVFAMDSVAGEALDLVEAVEVLAVLAADGFECSRTVPEADGADGDHTDPLRGFRGGHILGGCHGILSRTVAGRVTTPVLLHVKPRGDEAL